MVGETCIPVQKSTFRQSTLKVTVDNCMGNPIEESEKNSEKKYPIQPIQLFSSPLPQQQKNLGNEFNCANRWEQPDRGSKIPGEYIVFNSPPKQQFNHNHHQQLSQIYYNNIKSQEQYYERLPQLQQRHTVDNSRGKPVEKSHQIIYQRPLPHQQKILGNECLEMIENKWEQFNCGSNISEEDSNRREQCSCATKIPKEQFNHHHQLSQIYCNNLKFQKQYYQHLLRLQRRRNGDLLHQQHQRHEVQLQLQQHQLLLQQQQHQLQLQRQKIKAQQLLLQLQQQQIQQQKIRRKSPTNKPLLEAPKYSQDIIDLYNDALKKPFEFSRLVRVGAFPSQNEN